MTEHITPLHQLCDGDEGDFFALLSEKQLLSTRDGKPYHRVSFRDAKREVSFPIWSDAPHSKECRETWQVGQFFKLRAGYRETTYGPQLDIIRIRPVVEADAADGFDPLMCAPRTRFDPQEMFDELMEIAEQAITDQGLRELVTYIYRKHHDELLQLPAARVNHHAYLGGYLEHVLNVTRHARFLAERYFELYDQLEPRVSVELTVAGALLHDIGKLRELATGPAGADYTPSGTLIGHILQGRDILREAAADIEVDSEQLLRLEHIIVSHQRLPEWGSPKAPMFPEALIVHHADDLDAKMQMMACAIEQHTGDDPFTTKRNPLHQVVYRGPNTSDTSEDEEAAEPFRLTS
jgi:3'-5' exoribonuclease